MSESIGTARLDIVVDTSSLEAGVDKATRSTRDMAKASQDASQKMDAGTKRQVQSLERQIATLGKSRSEVIRWRIEQQTSGRVAAELSAKLDAQTARLAATSGTMDKVGASAKRFAAAWVAIGAAVGGAVLVAGVKNAIDFADKLNDINIRLGISAEALSGWAYAAQQTGTDIDGLGKGMLRLSRNLAAGASETSEQSKLFKALGVDVKDARGNLRSLEQVLPDIASRFKAIENETLKAALAQELFGKSGAELIEFLNQGGDGLDAMRERARELGVELSQGTLSAADRFNDSLAELKSASMGLFTQIAASLMPAMEDLVVRFTELVREGTLANNMATVLSATFSAGVSVLEEYDNAVRRTAIGFELIHRAASGAAETVKNLATFGFADGGVLSGIRQIMDANSDAQAALDRSRADKPNFANVRTGSSSTETPEAARANEFEARLNRMLADRGKGGAKKAKKEGRSEEERELERLQKSYQSLIATQAERIALFGNESEAAKVRYELENGELSKLTEAQLKKLGIDKELAIANAERLDTMREEAKVQEDLKRIEEARTERTKDVLDDIRTEMDLMGKSIEYQDTYNKLKYAGVDANSAFGQSIIEANAALHEQGRAMEAQIELMDTFRNEASNALSDFVTGAKSAKEAFTDFFDNMAERITQMIAERWIEQLFGQQGTTGQGSSGGDWIGQLMGLFFSSGNGAMASGGASGGGFAKGGAFSGGQVQAFANGGVFDRPTMFGMSAGRLGVMGEAGPEAIVPLHRGPDGKLGIRMAAANDSRPRQVAVNQTFIVQGAPDSRTREQMARASGREAARGMTRTGR